MRPVREEDASLRANLRIPAVVEGAAATAAKPWTVSAPATFQMVAAETHSEQPPAASLSPASPSPASPSPIPQQQSVRPVSKAKHCHDCGHKCQIGPFAKYHRQSLPKARNVTTVDVVPGAKCSVPQHMRRLPRSNSSARGLRRFGGEECRCTGDEDHPGGCLGAVPHKRRGKARPQPAVEPAAVQVD